MNFLKWSLIFVFLFSFLFVKGQNVYNINWKTENYYFGTGAVTFGFGFFLVNKEAELSVSRINELSIDQINVFDRWAVHQYSTSVQGASDILFFSSFAYPFLLTIPKRTRKDLGRISLLYGETLFVTFGLTLLAKGAINRPRPYVYNDNPVVELAQKQKRNSQFSFFSGHSSLTSANTFFAAKVFADFYPDSKLKPYVWGLAAAIPAVTGYLRIEGGKHFPTDVLMGYAVGASAGILIPHFHKNRSKESNISNLMILPSYNGMIVNYTF